MSGGRLLFSQGAPVTNNDVRGLLAQLTDAGFIGQEISPGTAEYFTGDRFLQLVTFMGCSPFLKLKPDDESSDDFCRIRILGPYAKSRFLEGRNTRPPRCPGCRKSVEDWRSLVDSWNAGRDTGYRCPSCSLAVPFTELEWRQNAGSGRLFIEITRIFPGEAVPVQALLDILGSHGTAWNYFYIQD